MPASVALSVIVAVHDASPMLGDALSAILASALPRHEYELIVVDDASGDQSVAVAARHADVVIRLPGRRAGPAYARNRGVERARGRLVAFVDVDVRVQPITLPRMMAELAAHPEVDAIVATSDDHPTSDNTTSQYWSLLHHLAGRQHAGPGAHVMAGCCMVRRDAFLAVRMYDEWRFRDESVEGLELGQRLVAHGHTVLLSGEVQVTLMRRWSPRSLVREVWRRSEAIARSLGYQHTRLASPSEVIFTLGIVTIPVMLMSASLALIAPTGVHARLPEKLIAALVLIVAANLRIYRFLARTRGLAFTARVAPLHAVSQLVSIAGLCLGWFLRDAIGDGVPDATTQAFAEVGVEMWPPVPRQPL